MTTPTHIPLHELPARMRLLADDMAAVGAAIRYFGGFGAVADYGDMLETQSAMVARDLASVLESMQGGRA